MKTLVTGGAGFIGSHLVDRLISDGHSVVIVDDLSGGVKENINPKTRLHVCDVRNFKQIDEIFNIEKPKLVFHLAANAAENKAQFSPIDITSRNYDAFIKTLTAGIRNGMKRIVVTSSIAVYGEGQVPFKESCDPQPEDLYGVSKLAIERSLKIMAKVHGFEYVIVRPHNVYGPRQNMRDPYRNVVTIFMNSLLRGKPYYIYGDGEQRRCFSYIDDVVEAIYNCGFRNVSGRIFNIGSDNDYSLNELSRVIQNVSSIKISPVYISSRPNEVKIAVSDHGLARTVLGYEDKTDLITGIKKTWEWVQGIGPLKPLFTEIEIESGKLPINWKVVKREENAKEVIVYQRTNGGR